MAGNGVALAVFAALALHALAFHFGCIRRVEAVACVTESDGAAKLCLSVARRAKLVEVGQNTSLALLLETHRELNQSVFKVTQTGGSVLLGVEVDSERITKPPPWVPIQNGSQELVLFGSKAGRAVISFHCEDNDTKSNDSICQFSQDSLYYLRRGVSFANSLPLEVASDVVGWIYCIVWISYFYPQVFKNCRRCSVSGFSLYRIFLCFSGSVAYSVFNVALFWIPQIQEEYYSRHPEGVIPVLLNDVVFALNAALASGIWVLQVVLVKEKCPKMSWYGGLFIASLWLVMLSCVVVGAAGFLEWLDALYIISYIRIVTITLQYAPQVWLNYRRKSTEGCSAYSPILGLVGGSFSVIQMLMLSYNYDDWESIFGDPTKFGMGAITASFCVLMLFQHYVLYRKSWMKKYKLSIECDCDPGCCKCKINVNQKKTYHKVCDSVALPDEKLKLKSIIQYV